LDWLNESTGDEAHFFGIELQLVRISESVAAPLLNVVAQSNDWQKQVRTATKARAVSGKDALYVQFWTDFIDRVHAEHPDWTKAKAAGPYNWFEMKGATRGTLISSSFAQGDRLRHELYIDTGDGDRNDELFESLRDQQLQIEDVYGRPLKWEELPTRRACRIAEYMDGCRVADTARWDEYTAWFLDAGTRLRRALSSVALPV
jgi:hypothetical protein